MPLHRAVKSQAYHVLVVLPNERRFLILIHATSEHDARRLVAVDWGDENIRDVSLA